MKILHLSDLHIGKILHKYSMLDDQKYILDEILKIIDFERPDSIIIAGDIYDKGTPSTDAVMLLDDFITKLSQLNIPIIIISGNHDSPERLFFGTRIMKKNNIHITSIFSENCTKPLVLHDDYGDINVYSIPFIRPVNVNDVYKTDFTDYTQAYSYVLDKLENFDKSKRNIIAAHQYVSGAAFSDSETSVGGVDCIAREIFEQFDYTALGHIHRPQNVGNKKIRYCGTPMKYSEKEANTNKSVTIAELKEKGNLEVRTISLKPKHDIKVIKERFEDIISNKIEVNTEDYIFIELLDENIVINAREILSKKFPRLLELNYANKKNPKITENKTSADISEKLVPFELFSEFFRKQHDGISMTEEQSELIKEIINEIWGFN